MAEVEWKYLLIKQTKEKLEVLKQHKAVNKVGKCFDSHSGDGNGCISQVFMRRIHL